MDEIPNDDPENKTKTLTAKRYARLLRDSIIPDLKERLSPQNFGSCHFWQDGAPSHTSDETLQYLREVFGNRLISSRRRPTAFEWAPYSPDLSSGFLVLV